VAGVARAKRGKQSGGIYYGWVILFVSYMLMFFTAGLTQAFGVFLVPMTDDFGWDRSAFALALSIFAVVSAIVPPVAGRLADRYGPRLVLTAGAALNALGMVLMAFTQSLWYAYIVYGVVIGLGFGIAGQSANAALLSRWFVKRRGMALSVSSTGLGMGQLILVPLATLITIHFSWRTAFVVMGVMAAIMVPMCLILLRREEPPEDHHEASESTPPRDLPATACLPSELIRRQTRAAFRSRSFWLLGGGFMGCGFTIYLLMTHVVAMATDRGISAGQAGTALGLVGGTGIVSGVIVGSLSDRIGRKHLLAGLYLLRAASVVVLMGANSATELYLFAIMFGLSRANGALVSAAVIDLYGRHAVGSILGYTTTFHQLFAALGAWTGGIVYDTTGSYMLALAPCIVLLLGGSAASLLIDEKRPERVGRSAGQPVSVSAG
jgi:predicted MFS family arabinose efflux permease